MFLFGDVNAQHFLVCVVFLDVESSGDMDLFEDNNGI